MVLSSILTFCRIVVGFVFGISFLRKAIDVPAFEQTITLFAVLPNQFSRKLALLFLGGELTVVLLVILGGSFLGVGFVLGIALLLVFCGALMSVLRRHIQTSCNCFGSSQKPVSAADVWRNISLIMCALLGVATLAGPDSGHGGLNLAEWGLVGLGSVIFVTLWLHLGEIVQLFQQD